MPIFCDPWTATSHAASSAWTRRSPARISSSRLPAGARDPSPASCTSAVRAAKMSRSTSAEKGRSTMLSTELAGSPMVKLSWLFRSSSSAAILRRATLVSRSNDSRSTASAATDDVPRWVAIASIAASIVLGLHDDVEELVAPFERTHERVGDLPARDPGVILGHDASVTIDPHPRRRLGHAGCRLTAIPEYRTMPVTTSMSSLLVRRLTLAA